MKSCVMLLAAALFAGAANAVTVEWNSPNFTLLEGHSAIGMVIMSGSAAEATALAKTWKFDFGNSTNIGDVKLRDDGSSANAGGQLKKTIFSNNGSSWGAFLQNLTAAGEKSGSVTFKQDDWVAAGKPDKVSMLFFDATNFNAFNNNADLCYAVEVNVSEWQENDTWKDSVTVNVGNVALLPEPTVLALLALGVAGVALRRRAA